MARRVRPRNGYTIQRDLQSLQQLAMALRIDRRLSQEQVSRATALIRELEDIITELVPPGDSVTMRVAS